MLFDKLRANGVRPILFVADLSWRTYETTSGSDLFGSPPRL